ncbi:MAG: sugar ABC transporter permease [Saccharospirillaceae bacterium]|nr:sugar ABC transporter permease [Pseudomonadales bacterium]NRB77822.1 sugar ABC transporter permease [Saccharospirillaceae bacterium]
MNQSNKNLQHKYSPYLFTMPFIVVVLLFNIYPFAISLFTSFHQWQFGGLFDPSTMPYVGWENYSLVFSDPILIRSILSITVFIIIAATCIHVLALFIAKSIMLSYPLIQTVFIVLILIPFMIETDTISRMFVSPYIEGEWIVEINKYLVYAIVILSMVFHYVGFFTLLYFMGLKNINNEVKEAALMEGASKFDVFFKIELPLIKGLVYSMIILSIIFLFQESSSQEFFRSRLFKGGTTNEFLFTFYSLLESNKETVQAAITWVFFVIIISFVTIPIIIKMIMNKFKRINK